VKIYYRLSAQRSSKSERRNSDGNRKWARSWRAGLSMRVAGKWQRHTSTIYTPRSRIRKKPVVPRLLIPTYYSAVVARRYLKSDMSNTNAARRPEADVSRVSNCRIFIVIRGTITAFAVFSIRPGWHLHLALFVSNVAIRALASRLRRFRSFTVMN